MSERSRRDIQRFDYKVYNKTGKKVCKAASNEFVIMGDLIEEELKVSCKINRVLNEFELELFYDIENIRKYSKVMKMFTSCFEGSWAVNTGKLQRVR